MSKVAIIFTDTPDGGFDVDVVPVGSPPSLNSPSLGAAMTASKLFLEYTKKQGSVISEESGVLKSIH